MIEINFATVKNLVFEDQEIQKRLPEYKDLFQQWKLGTIVPSLRPMAQKALLDLLNQLGDEQISTLEAYFREPVKVKKLDYTLVKSHTVPLLEAQERIEGLDVEGELFLYRNANHLYIAAWR